MYDLHNHILPGVDDGPRTMGESVEMARIAQDEGTKVILATPHQRDVAQKSSVAHLSTLVQELNTLLQGQGLTLRVALGMENHVEPKLPQWVEEGNALTINGTSYILVELDFLQYPVYADQVLFQLQLQGLTPVIAHVERQATIQKDPQVLERLVSKGMLSQITAGSLTGALGSQARQAAQRLLRRNLVHIIASDAHTPQGPRSPLLSQGLRAAARLVGEGQAHAMLVDNPQAILEGRKVLLPELAEAQVGPWWAFWR